MGDFFGPLMHGGGSLGEKSCVIVPEASRSSMAIYFRVLAIVFCLASVLFFALKPAPEVPSGLAPEDVRVYLNIHDALRNQLAFGFFGFTALVSLMRTTTFLTRTQILAISLIALLVPALEVAQVWMPERHVDIGDVLNGWTGLGLGCALYVIVWSFWQIALRSISKN
jgi:VanZ family protein